MSKFAKDGNNFRREWDIEAFEKKAKERLDAELQLEEDREHKMTEPAPIVQRAPLMRRTEDLQLAKRVNTRQVISGAEALSGIAGAYYCKVCECGLRDSANYLAHINGRKHNRMLGMSMRAERSTVGEVKARLEAHKQERDDQDIPKEKRAEMFLEEFDERIKQREEEERGAAGEKRRLAKERRAAAHAADAAPTGELAQACAAAADGDEEQGIAAPTAEEDEMAAMGFGGFGGSRKTN